jgi:hypothetical protein
MFLAYFRRSGKHRSSLSPDLTVLDCPETIMDGCSASSLLSLLCVIVTHDFGHLGDVLTIVYSGSQQELSPEKSGIYLLLENIFSK